MADRDVDYKDRAGVHPLSCCLSLMFPCTWLCSCYTVQENEQALELYFGRYQRRVAEPGIVCSNPCGRTVLTISTKQISHDLQNTKV